MAISSILSSPPNEATHDSTQKTPKGIQGALSVEDQLQISPVLTANGLPQPGSRPQSQQPLPQQHTQPHSQHSQPLMLSRPDEVLEDTVDDEANTALPPDFLGRLAEANDEKYRPQKESYLHRLKSQLAHITTLDLLLMKAENWDYINTEEFEFLSRASGDNSEVKKLLKQLSAADIIKKESKKKKGALKKELDAKKRKVDENEAETTIKKRNVKKKEEATPAIKLKTSKLTAAEPPIESATPADSNGEIKKTANGRFQRAAKTNASSKIEAALHEGERKPKVEETSFEEPAVKNSSSLSAKDLKAVKRQYDNTYFTIWKDLSRKDAPKIHRLIQQATQTKLINLRKTAILCVRESKKWQLKTNKSQKDLQAKARRGMREMFSFWKRNEREERDLRKKAEKEALDQAKREEEERESRRQARKLNFLITQTELYSHFIGRKMKTDEIEGNTTGVLGESQHNDVEVPTNATRTAVSQLDFDSDNEEEIQRAAAANAQSALLDAQARAKQFDAKSSSELKQVNIDDDDLNFQNPTSLGDITIEQPKLLSCTLKEYQVKGLNWLANLYDQGINGILADEMGLGKTVQSISVLAYLAETHNIWGPFLVVSPASTLHNWQQEVAKFVPDFKVLPYWGNSKDRKVLRKFWDRKNVRYTKDSPFHVLVTSYQLVVADIQYFQRIKWQYMILDEAQAIKSSSSSRWKSLLGLQCRNRLLLTGTPIQNSMQELWALLHFIMPTLFDSHDEFSEWFSKDIESHAQSNTELNEQQLRRLHALLKPFMLRRIKKNVQSELGDKIEIDVYCNLTNRQKKLYKMLRSQISLMDLIEKATSGSDDSNQSLINLVMQFRKVCNHPDLFERDDVKSSFSFGSFAETGSFLRESNQLELAYSTKNMLSYEVPKLLYRDMLLPNDNNTVDIRENILKRLMNIWNTKYISENNKENNAFSWLRFIDSTPRQAVDASRKDVIERAIDMRSYAEDEAHQESDDHRFLLIDDKTKDVEPPLKEIQKRMYYDMYINVQDSSAIPPAAAPPVDAVCRDRSFVNHKNNVLFDPKIRQALSPLSLDSQLDLMENGVPLSQFPKAEMLPQPLSSKSGYSSIKMPSMNRFIKDSAKLAKLDEMLPKLKSEDHRVLIYFQMTKMMDLMEEYLTYRQYKFIRLDGSSKLEDRRDLVNDWQTRPEIFVFLLSTRAGGLGINLTAADTVIFYDSDWNPTIDSQAMDRAHRLGQTRQVTVYRLLVRGTIEERMRDRAKQKEHVQQVVMEGKTDQNQDTSGFQKPTREVALWLLDENEGGADALKNKQLEAEEKKVKRKKVQELKANNARTPKE
jgi:DNA helicase INO80